MKRSCALLVGLFCVAMLTVCSVGAQTITVNNDLVFGDIFPGIPKTIAKETPGAAAEFHITGTAGAEVSVDFTLPTYMSNGSNNAQLVFTETDCAMDSSASPDQSNPGNDDLDPWHQMVYYIGSEGLTVWLGGIVIPKLVQPQGDYTALIVLTVAYTGT